MFQSPQALFQKKRTRAETLELSSSGELRVARQTGKLVAAAFSAARVGLWGRERLPRLADPGRLLQDRLRELEEGPLDVHVRLGRGF